MHLQLAFVIKALAGLTMDDYFTLRGLKYSARPSITPLFTTLPSYLSDWLSGFIEAEGCFAIRSGSLGFSFSTGQLNDRYLMSAILEFFGQTHLTIQEKKDLFFFIEIANIRGVTKVVQYLLNHPLQGHKYYQLALLMKSTQSLSHLRHKF